MLRNRTHVIVQDQSSPASVVIVQRCSSLPMICIILVPGCVVALRRKIRDDLQHCCVGPENLKAWPPQADARGYGLQRPVLLSALRVSPVYYSLQTPQGYKAAMRGCSYNMHGCACSKLRQSRRRIITPNPLERDSRQTDAHLYIDLTWGDVERWQNCLQYARSSA